MTTEKKQEFQIARGLAIIFVLIHHAIAQVNSNVILDSLDYIIICFHMPVFFVIAGYLFEVKNNKYIEMGKGRFLLNKAKHLLVPYAFWSFVLWGGIQTACHFENMRKQLFNMGFTPMSFKNFLYGFLTYEQYYIEHLWFIYVLFNFFVIHMLLGNLGNKKAMIALTLIAGLVTNYVNFPHIIERSMIWMIFFCCGRYIANNLENYLTQFNDTKKLIIISALFAYCCYLRLSWKNQGDVVEIKLLQQIIKYIIGFLGTMLVYICASWLRKTAVSKMFIVIGNYSYDIYLMHNPYIVALSSVVLGRLLGLNVVLTIFVSVVLGISIPLIASKVIINRFTLMKRIMLGK